MKPEELKLVLDALDNLGVALAAHGHTWAVEERRQYEAAISLLVEHCTHANQ